MYKRQPVQTLAELRHIRIKADQLHILRAKNRTAHSGIALDDSIFTVRMTAGISICHILSYCLLYTSSCV